MWNMKFVRGVLYFGVLGLSCVCLSVCVYLPSFSPPSDSSEVGVCSSMLMVG
jgi:hypothetical protein